MDYALPQTLAAKIQELERRIRDLERSPKLTSASVTGTITVYDDDGNKVAGIGENPTVGTAGIVVNDSEEKLIFSAGTNDTSAINGVRMYLPSPPGEPEYIPQQPIITMDHTGLKAPFIPHPMAPRAAFGAQPYNVTSGTFTPVLSGLVIRVPVSACYIAVRASVSAGTVGEIRLTHLAHGGAQTSAHTVSSTSVSTFVFEWEHGVPIHEQATFFIEARRVSGAGNVSLYDTESGLVFAGDTYLGATSTGI